jgi:RNA ligase (TIGR02306 family)
MRKMASIQRIAEVKSIEGADLICAYRINGWWVVDKVGAYSVDDLVVFCEVDSWIPTELAAFLSKGKEPREYLGIKGEKLRTVRLKKQLSQGLLLPISVLSNVESELMEDLDVSIPLNIQKYEPPLPAQLAGQVKGNFPALIPKTDAVRIQNVRDWSKLVETHRFEVTEKLHGSSCTFYLDTEGEFHVCSRNLDLKFDENNAYWKAAIKYNVEQKMKDNNLHGIAIQGEIIGLGLNGNQYNIPDIDFFVFNVYNIANNGFYLTAPMRTVVCEEFLGLKQVPKLGVFLTKDVQSMLVHAEGKSVLNGSEREGIVLKSQQDTSLIIKVVSNKWLLGGGEEQ